MKKPILVLILIFFIFSCKSKPDIIDELSEDDSIKVDEIVILDDGMLDDIDTDINIENEENSLIDEETQIADYAETEEEIIEEEIEIVEETRTEEDTQIAQVREEPSAPTPPAVLLQPPVPPSARTPTPPPTVQAPPSALVAETVEEEKEAAAEQTPSQTQPTQRTWPAPVAPIREDPPTPTQSVVVPREGDLAVLPREGDIVFSRIVRATVGQIIEIPFRGTNWVYLGEILSKRGIVYDSRRLDPGTASDSFQAGQSFIFRAEEVGIYALKFSRQDFIRDYILNDHVQVIVGESPVASTGWFSPPVDRGRVVAQPRWPSAIEEAEILKGGTRPATEQPREQSREPREQREPRDTQSTGIAGLLRDGDLSPPVPISPPIGVLDNEQPPATDRQPFSPNELSASIPAQPSAVSQDAASIPQESGEIIAPDQIIKRAKEAFEAGNAAAAIALLDQYAAVFPSGTDELYWLYGQFYEANTPSRNIKLSLEYYRKLIDEFPQSSRFNDARRRIAYLERFYINIQ